ncbi:hypothetical protein ACMC56_09940 [Campylobacterota bacterium DY0563]
MVKIILIVIVFFNLLFADVYENNCLKCHNKLPVSIDKYFYRYLLKYSSEKEVKRAMATYLKNPTEDTTIMPQAFINRFGVKKKTKLSDKELKKALDIYWEKYKVFGKLK